MRTNGHNNRDGMRNSGHIAHRGAADQSDRTMIIDHLAGAGLCVCAALLEMEKHAKKNGGLTPTLYQVNEHLFTILEEFRRIDGLLNTTIEHEQTKKQ